MADVIAYTLDTIQDAATATWLLVQGHRVITFSGDMGAGKTTLIHALCEHLGVTDNVSSPTYALINEYRVPQQTGGMGVIYHMDWYRLRDAAEAINAGVEDCLHQPGALCFVEWPEIARELLPKRYAQVQISITGAQERTVSINFIDK